MKIVKHDVHKSPATDSAIRPCLAGTSGEAAYFLSVNTLKEEVPSIGLPPLTLVAIFRPRHHFNSANWVGGRGGRGQTEGPSKGEKEMEESGVDLAILDIWCSRRRAHTEWFSMSNLARESISRWGVRSRVI